MLTDSATGDTLEVLLDEALDKAGEGDLEWLVRCGPLRSQTLNKKLETPKARQGGLSQKMVA